MTNPRRPNRVVELPRVGVVLLVFDDGVETVTTVEDIEFIDVVNRVNAERLRHCSVISHSKGVVKWAQNGSTI
jgi:hypothetical protein